MENAMFERLELQSDDILQAYYMRSQSLLLLEYAGTLEETLGFSDSTDKPQAVLAQMAAAESPTNGEKLQQAEYFLAFTEKNGEVWLYFCSRTNAVRAVDLLDSIVEEMGLVKGNAVSASGRVPAALFKAHMTGMDAADYMEFVQGNISRKTRASMRCSMRKCMRKRYWRWIVIARRGSAGRLCRPIGLRPQERNWRLNPWKMKQVLRSLQIRIYTL